MASSHSGTATLPGFAVAIGAVSVVIHGRITMRRVRDAAAVGASVLVPLAMTVWDGSAGARQRAMFAAEAPATEGR